MPTPIELLLDPVSLAVFAIYGGIVAWETLAPARPLPAVKGWRLRGLAAFAAFFFLSSYLSMLWTEDLAAYRLVDLTGLGTQVEEGRGKANSDEGCTWGRNLPADDGGKQA